MAVGGTVSRAQDVVHDQRRHHQPRIIPGQQADRQPQRPLHRGVAFKRRPVVRPGQEEQIADLVESGVVAGVGLKLEQLLDTQHREPAVGFRGELLPYATGGPAG